MKRRAVAAAVVAVFAAGAALWFSLSSLPERAVAPGTPSSPGPAGPVAEMDLYFSDAEGQRLAIERREVGGATPEERIRLAVAALAAGPARADLSPTLPPETQVRSVFLRDDTAWVDLSSSASEQHPGGAWAEVLAVYSVVDTVTGNLPQVARVQILIEGREAETLAGHVDISRPLRPRLQLLSGRWE